MKPYYQDSLVTIYHGDCRNVLPTLSRLGVLFAWDDFAVITDPPYGIGLRNGDVDGHRSARSFGIEGDADDSAGRWLIGWAGNAKTIAIDP